MKRHLPDSPVKLALLSVLGSLLASIIFVAPWLPNHHRGQLSAYLLFGLALFAVSFVLSLKCTSNLRRGIKNQNWPESQIEPLRKHLESPWYTALSIALFIAFVLFMNFFESLKGEGWVCFLLLQNLSQLCIAVRRPMSSKPSGPLTGWRSFGPIQSDHWGSR